MEEQARNFPALNRSEVTISEMNESEEIVVPMNPIELRDTKIAALEETIKGLKTKDDEITQLKEAIT